MTLKKPDIERDQNSISPSGSLTVELLKSFDGCQKYTDEEAEQIVCGLRQLACILFEFHQQKENKT